MWQLIATKDHTRFNQFFKSLEIRRSPNGIAYALYTYKRYKETLPGIITENQLVASVLCSH